MKVYIPHIHYTVNLVEIKKSKGNIKNFLSVYENATERIDKNTSNIYFNLPIKRRDLSTLAHELVHVLQNICGDRNISFTREEENTAYILHFLMNEFTGYKYDNIVKK